MTPFSYARAAQPADAIARGAAGARFLGGGTNLIDLMRQRIEAPAALLDISQLPGAIEEMADGGLLVGASVKNSALAAHPAVRARYPVLARAILAGASAQIRNMATVGGNLLQRTRCVYFYDPDGSRCNKRQPGSGCDAFGGFTRYHAVLGGSDQCIATNPSDMCVALAALDAEVRVVGPAGSRAIPFTRFHRLPGPTPHIETELQAGELITHVAVPPLPAAANSTYRKVRDRASYAFALVSVAAVLEVSDGAIGEVRLGLGGVGTKPWRATRAEAELRGTSPSTAAFRRAAEAELAAAQPVSGNEFKAELARRTIVAVLEDLAERAR
jgi:xanthine dehydrogenase YagS FAD-binding subunit